MHLKTFLFFAKLCYIKIVKKNFFVLLSLLLFGFVFSFKPQIAHAEVQIEVTGPSFIEIKNMPDYFEVVATLSDNTFSGNDIIWFKETTRYTQNISYTTNSSTLKIFKSDYENIKQETSLTFTAKINSNQTIEGNFVVKFGYSDISQVNLEFSGPSTQIISNNIKSVILTANIVGAPSNVEYQWFLKNSTNKYEKFGSNQSQITYTPSKAGTFCFIVMANGVISNEVSIAVVYKEITALSIRVHRATQNSSGLDRYTFLIDNIPSSEANFYDISKINWYDINGNLLQTGGLTFDYQITQPTSLTVYAKYNNITSGKERIEVTVNRKKDILIVLAVSVGIMAIVTTIGIIANIKKDRIW